jgi:exodeoxyribonuclease VII small subunit
MAARTEPGPSDDGAGSDGGEFADVAELSYEDARDELTAIVAQLEGGQVPLEEGMRLWRRGEALAAHCTVWLDGAQRQISEAGPA